LSGKEVGDEMLSLQADDAKASTALRKHVSNCAICQFFLRNSTEESEYDWYEKSRRMPAGEIRRLSRQERYEALKKEPHAAPEDRDEYMGRTGTMRGPLNRKEGTACV
jgi:hypothetical protein